MSQQTKLKRLQYSPTKMAEAIANVRSGAMSRCKAARTYGVPKTTLLDKLSGRVPEQRVRPGPPSVLTSSEEDVLIHYVKLMASIGYPLTRVELCREVKKILDIDGRSTPFKNNLPGRDWFYGFRRRHTDISERSAMCLGHQRAFVNCSMVDGWYAGLHTFLSEEVDDYKELISDPRRLFNADESGFPLCLKTGKVIAATGSRHVYHVTTSNKCQVTVMVCFNAFGDFVPPLIVFPGERLRETGIDGFPEAIYGKSANGWMDSELFISFLEHFSAFVDESKIKKPVILFVDGHSTHMSCDAANYCADHGIILYCLLANATHILQPCDVGFFSPMKSAWKRAVKSWQLDNIGETLTKKQFPGVFKSAWESVATFEVAAHGFRRAGLFPLDRKGIDMTKLEPSYVANPNVSIAASITNNVTPVQSTLSVASASVDRIDSVTCMSTISSSMNLPIPSTSNTACMPCVRVVPNIGSEPAHSQEVTVTPSMSRSQLDVRQTTVSSAFNLLTVPEPKQRNSIQPFTSKLPKALSGKRALEMFAERKAKKEAEELAKLERQRERERKRQEKEQAQALKKQEREAKKLEKEQNKLEKLLEKKKRKRRSSSSDSDTENRKIKIYYEDSDDSYDESQICPGCHTDDALNDSDEWIVCVKCSRKWHVTCSGDPILSDITVAELKEYPFHCEYCL